MSSLEHGQEYQPPAINEPDECDFCISTLHKLDDEHWQCPTCSVIYTRDNHGEWRIDEYEQYE